MFLVAIFLAGMLMNSGETDSEACARLASALEDPIALSVLDGWYKGLPRKYSEGFYRRGQDPLDQIKSGTYRKTVPGSYKADLTIDPKSVHLRDYANIGARFDSSGRLSYLRLGDNRYVFFVFRLDSNFVFGTEYAKVSKSGDIAVFCQRVGHID